MPKYLYTAGSYTPTCDPSLFFVNFTLRAGVVRALHAGNISQ